MAFAHLPPYIPFLDSQSTISSIDHLKPLTTITPFLISLSLLNDDDILSKLPNRTEYYIYDDLSHHDQQENRSKLIISSLDRGAIKVITDLSSDLIQLGVSPQRIIPRKNLCSKIESLDNSSCSGGVLLEVDQDFHQNDDASRDLEDILKSYQSQNQIFLLDPFKTLKPLTPSTRGSSNRLIQVINSTDLIQTDLDPLIDLFLSRLHTDRPDKLFSTSVVSTSPSSTLLGQVYSSLESIKLSIKTQKATYFSRSRNQIWLKGETSGATQELVRIRSDCDGDSLEFQVIQKPLTGFCHTEEISCFGPLGGLKQLESTLVQRKQSSVPGSYTNRLFTDEKLLKAKIMEEAEELCEAESPEDVQGEMADLIYFALCRCISKGVSLEDIETKLNQRSLKVTRRKGDAKPKWEAKVNSENGRVDDPLSPNPSSPKKRKQDEPDKPLDCNGHDSLPLRCQTIDLAQVPPNQRPSLLKRPMTDSRTMNALVNPIIDMVKKNGDQGLLEAVQKFDKCAFENCNNLVLSSPFPDELMKLPSESKEAIDVAYQNIHKFHDKQLDKERTPMVVETMKGVVCSRFARAIERVGLYVPGGTAVLPSTALMLAIPAQIAGCSHITIATPPRADGSIAPEIMYIASKCGVNQIVKAGGAHAIAALAYGTQTVAKVDKIFGPGNQFVTVAKMIVASDTQAGTAIDMPAGPSEVLVIADQSCNPVFVAADLLSQAEHGIDSQVILISIGLSDEAIGHIESQIDSQAKRLSRFDIIKQSIAKSFIVKVPSIDEAFELSNQYAPEHLILHLQNPNDHIHRIINAGSVFIGAFSPESCGDYASGTNHSLPTVGFAKQYSGVSTMSFMKHITTQELSPEGLQNLGPTVVRLAQLEGLDGHANAVQVRLLRSS